MKKTLKKLFVVLLALGFVASFASCKKDAEPETNSGRSDTQQTQPNNGDDNNNNGEQGDNGGQSGDNGGQSGDNGGTATAANAYYSFEITDSTGATYFYDKDGKVTSKKDAEGNDAELDLEGFDSMVADYFISFALGSGDAYTSFIAMGTEMVQTSDDPDMAAYYAVMYKYSIADGVLTLTTEGLLGPEEVLKATIDGDIYKAEKSGLKYSFKKAE